MRKYNYILFDANNLYWRSFITGVKKHKNSNKLVSAGIIEAFSKIKKLLKTYGRADTKVFFIFDNPTHEISLRKVIDPSYKHPRDRKNIPAQLYQTMRTFQQILRSYSDYFNIVVADKKEADDLTKPVLAHLQPTHAQPALCVSADMDWARNITADGEVDWFDWNGVVAHQSFLKKYGFLPKASAVKLYKCIRGDASDAISPGVPNLPKEIMLDIVTKFEDVDTLLECLWPQTDYPLDWKKKIAAHQAELRINWRLVDFMDSPLTYEQLVVPCVRSPRQARLWFESLEMTLEPWMKEKQSVPAFFQNRASTAVRRA